MGERDYSDRFDPKKYANDEPIHIWILGGDAKAQDIWIPERIWYRIVNVGKAYDLHLLPLCLPIGTDDVFLNGLQAESLIDEIVFVATIMDDDIVRDVVTKLEPLLAEARLHKGIGIEGP